MHFLLITRRVSCSLNTAGRVIHNNARNFYRPRLKQCMTLPKAKLGLFFLGAASGIGLMRLSPLCPSFSVVSCQSNEPSIPKNRASEGYRKAHEWSTKELIAIVWPEIFHLIGAIMGALTAAVMNIYIPIYLGDLVNVLSRCVGSRENMFALYTPTLKLCSAYLTQSASTFLYIGLLASIGERLAARLRASLFAKLIYQDMSYFDLHNAGKLIDSITADVQAFKSSFKQCISYGLRSTTQVLGSIFALLSISPTLTCTLLGFLPCVFLIGSLMGTELRRLSRQAQLQSSLATSIADESFTHIRSVKALALEEAQIDRFCLETGKAKELNERLGYGIGVFQGLSNLALNGIVIGVLYVGAHLLSRNELTPGHLMSFLVTTETMQRSLAQLSLLYGHVVRGNTALNRVFEILHSASSVEGVNSGDGLFTTPKGLCDYWRQPGCAPDLRFDSVQFAYPCRPDATVLKTLDMVIPAGRVVALVGQSGAGKSTVVALVERFYDPSAGRILLGNHDLRDFTLDSLRGQMIGYISQEPQIFHTTIRENIRFGKPDATDEQVEEAARMANAHEFITTQLPQGYDTVVGQGADTVAGLSGGQRQRIAIARVLLKNAPVVLLDEATSALDAESEAQVQSALKTVMKGRTVLVIAHRLSTVRDADLILVMSGGKIVEQGTHDTLMSQNGVYHKLVQRQEGHEFLH
ncbi:unnamed protein product [Calicophoron daubneyi]|uniref:Mitochondrial potassium channel ATP-binding subunit n=1 Tax=Calicophoron daubneyi TaxID=300641 RepID=A0AAV2T699_CALDB